MDKAARAALLTAKGMDNKSENIADYVADLLRQGRASEVTDDLMAQADPQRLYQHYTSGNTGMDLPMDYASRMERAARMGLTEKSYHGTGKSFPYFNPALGGTGAIRGNPIAKEGIFTSPMPEMADRYAEQGAGYQKYNEGGNNIPLMVKPATASVPLFNAKPEDLQNAKQQGHASVNLNMKEDPWETVTFDPTKMRSQFARFDPRLEHLAHLSASTGGAMEFARHVEAVHRAGGQIAPSKYMPNVPRAVHAGGGSVTFGKFATHKHGDTTIGYKIGDDGVAEVHSVKTPQAKRGQGSARAAMNDFLSALDEAGVKRTRLISSPLDAKTSPSKLNGFYETLGFNHTGERANQAGDPWMERQVHSGGGEVVNLGKEKLVRSITKAASDVKSGAHQERMDQRAYKLHESGHLPLPIGTKVTPPQGWDMPSELHIHGYWQDILHPEQHGYKLKSENGDVYEVQHQMHSGQNPYVFGGGFKAYSGPVRNRAGYSDEAMASRNPILPTRTPEQSDQLNKEYDQLFGTEPDITKAGGGRIGYDNGGSPDGPALPPRADDPSFYAATPKHKPYFGEFAADMAAPHLQDAYNLASTATTMTPDRNSYVPEAVQRMNHYLANMGLAGLSTIEAGISGGTGAVGDLANAVGVPHADRLVNDLGAMNETRGALPEGRMIASLTQPAIARVAAREVKPEIKGFEVYQGSPHNFAAERLVKMPDGSTQYIVGTPDALPDVPAGAKVLQDYPLGRMRMDKIGTGEGFQTYGYGMYGAEHENVAKTYRDRLSRNANSSPYVTQMAEYFLDHAGGDYKKAAESAKRVMSGITDPYEVRQLDEITKLLSSNKVSNGHMYHMHVKADPNEFINHDAPFHEQPKNVQKFFSHMASDQPNGKVLAKSIQTPEDAAKAAKAGIPGIKFFDKSSRPERSGTRNYVFFDDKPISILRKYEYGGTVDDDPAPVIQNPMSVFPKPQRMFPEDKRPKGGQYISTHNKADVTGHKAEAATIGIGPNGKPFFHASQNAVDQTGTVGKGSATTKTNLFKQKAGWKWQDAPEGHENTETIVSVEHRGKHFYALNAHFPKGVDLARYENATSEPRLRPTTQGNVTLGPQAGSISVRGKMHPVYHHVIVKSDGGTVDDALALTRRFTKDGIGATMALKTKGE